MSTTRLKDRPKPFRNPQLPNPNTLQTLSPNPLLLPDCQRLLNQLFTLHNRNTLLLQHTQQLTKLHKLRGQVNWLQSSLNTKPPIIESSMNVKLHREMCELQVQYRMESKRWEKLQGQYRHARQENERMEDGIGRLEERERELREGVEMEIHRELAFLDNKAAIHKYRDLQRIKARKKQELSELPQQSTLIQKASKLKQLKLNLLEQDIYLTKLQQAVSDQQSTITELQLALQDIKLRRVREMNKIVRYNTEQDLIGIGRMSRRRSQPVSQLDLREGSGRGSQKLPKIRYRREEEEEEREYQEEEDEEDKGMTLFKPIKIEKEIVVKPRRNRKQREQPKQPGSSSSDSDIFKPTKLLARKAKPNIEQVRVYSTAAAASPKKTGSTLHSRNAIRQPSSSSSPSSSSMVILQQQQLTSLKSRH